MMSVAIALRLPRSPSFRSADRHRVHQAAVSPQVVEPAIEFELGVLAERTVEDLAVISDELDLVIGPFLVEPERLAHARGYAEYPLDIGIVALRHLVDVL